MATFPTLFVSHGGGPWPAIPQAQEIYSTMRQSLERIPKLLPTRPKAILVVSAHWEEPEFSVAFNPRPGMLYDYYGFPKNTYELQYPAPGAEDLAGRVLDICTTARPPLPMNRASRDFDHGVFVPLMVAFPEADIPVLQMSLRADMDPEAHYRLGELLSPLRQDQILIIGSGFSYHNMRGYGPQGAATSKPFDDWLQSVVGKTEAVRKEALCAWHLAPSARACHPREEHLMPLLVAAGAAAKDPGTAFYHEQKFMGGVVASSFLFGAADTIENV